MGRLRKLGVHRLGSGLSKRIKRRIADIPTVDAAPDQSEQKEKPVRRIRRDYRSRKPKNSS